MDKEFCLMTIEALNLNLLDISNSDIQPLLNSLTIYPESQAELEFCGQKIRLAVIGESHFIMAENIFFELLVCKILPKDLFSGILAMDRKSGSELADCCFAYRSNDLNYFFISRFIDYWQQDRQLQPDGEIIFECEETFPFQHEGEELSCKTRLLLCQTKELTLCLQTMHDYPVPDGVTVVTRSIWDFPRLRGL